MTGVVIKPNRENGLQEFAVDMLLEYVLEYPVIVFATAR